MTFTTLTYLLFVPIVFWVYWALPGRRSRNWLILLASYGFYGWWDVRFCLLILISSVVDYCVGIGLGRASSRRSRRFLLGTSLAVNLGMLGFFKYCGFFVENAVELANSLGWRLAPSSLEIVLPIGISFYTFQTLSYVIDVYRGRLEPTRDFGAYMAYVAFFPQLVAGPIERGTRLLPQFLADRVFEADSARDGLRQILWGFVKKMVIADRLATVVDAAYAQPEVMSSGDLTLATICFSFQVYCDFSAYSDIAIGTARLFGIDLMRNFAYPFFSQSQREFWRRWHISLMSWLRDYLYVPLGGSKSGRWSTARNVILTFTLAGLWHGAAWHFVIWGMLCGVLVSLETTFGGRNRVPGPDDVPWVAATIPPPLVILRMVRTFLVFTVSICIFRAESLADAALILTRIVLGLGSPRVQWTEESVAAVGLIVALVIVEWCGRRYPHPLQIGRLPRPLRWAFYTIAIWVAVYFMAPDPLAFVYFQF